MNDDEEQTNAGSSAEVSQQSTVANVPQIPPQPREVKQDVIGTDERNSLEKETKSKK